MTIAVGFTCQDGVVICADRQLTNPGGFKYEERKIFSSRGGECQFMFSYAGFPDAANMMFDKVKDAIPEILSGKPPHSQDAKLTLEKIYKSPHTKGLQTLIGIRIRHFPAFLLKTFNNTVVEGRAEWIGSGDSSALRYLADFLVPSHLGIHEAEVLANYIVFVASRYVDGCAGGPDSATIDRDGKLSEGTGVFPNQKDRFLYCEQQIGKALREMLWSGGTKAVLTQPIS